MNRLGWLIIFGIVISISITFFKKRTKKLSTMVPKNCLCDFDDNLSVSRQKDVISTIEKLQKIIQHPQEVITQAMQEFPEILDMQAEICNADTVCFHAQTVKPLFLLNDKEVLLSNYVLLKKEDVDSDLLCQLPKITAENNQYESMVNFVEQLPKEIINECTLHWFDKELVLLKQNKDSNFSCLSCLYQVPTFEVYKKCCFLHAEKLKKLSKKNSQTMVHYDVRFKNQIIIKSGGKYG